MSNKFCDNCGCWLGDERYHVPYSADETLVLCWDCVEDDNCSEVLSEIDDIEDFDTYLNDYWDDYGEEY